MKLGSWVWFSGLHLSKGLYRFSRYGLSGNRARIRTMSRGVDGFYGMYEVDTSDLRLATDQEVLLYAVEDQSMELFSTSYADTVKILGKGK